MTKDQQPGGSQSVKIALMWAVVTLPLIYGVYNALKTAAQLFG